MQISEEYSESRQLRPSIRRTYSKPSPPQSLLPPREFLAVMALVLILICFGSVGVASGQQPHDASEWVGGNVELKSLNTVLMVGDRAVTRPGEFHSFRVEQANGPWLWVSSRVSGVKGWVRAIDVQSDPADRMIVSEYKQRALSNSSAGNFEGALSDFRKALKIYPNSVRGLADLAWFLATCPEGAFRDGPESLKLATRACEISKWKDERALEALAAAKAETGDFAGAVQSQRRSLATSAVFISPAAQTRLIQYLARRPYREGEKVEVEWSDWKVTESWSRGPDGKWTKEMPPPPSEPPH